MNLVLKAKKKGGGKRGNIAGLAKHLAKRYGGDPHFFTKCTKSEELASYNSEQRNGICAKAHKLATGIWPGEHGGKNKSGPEKKEESLEEWLNVVRTAVENKLNASIDTKSQPSAQYNWVESTYPDGRVIVRKGEEFYMLSFDVDEAGKIVVDDSNIIPVERGDWKPKVIKECCGKRKMTVRLKGGAGSGNFGHSGRPGKVGGSASGGGQATGGKNGKSAMNPTAPEGWSKSGSAYTRTRDVPQDKIDAYVSSFPHKAQRESAAKRMSNKGAMEVNVVPTKDGKREYLAVSYSLQDKHGNVEKVIWDSEEFSTWESLSGSASMITHNNWREAFRKADNVARLGRMLDKLTTRR